MSEEHLDPTIEVTLETIKERAVRGVVLLTGRTFILSFISLGATGLLTYYLGAGDLGLFWIISAWVNFLAYFSDIGLAAALIQKKEALSDQDLKTTFTIQQFLVLTLVGLGLVFVYSIPWLAKTSLGWGFISISKFLSNIALGKQDFFLFYALLFSLISSSLKTIPSILLERKLQFEKLVFPQVLENLVYNTVAVYFAWRGYGVNSFTMAILARSVVGLVSMYLIQPWMPGLAFSMNSLKNLLKYGLPYQMNTFLASIKDDGMTAILGGILGPGGVGILGWAQKWGQAPLRFFMDHVIKVTFPAFSRMQDEKEHLRASLERSIFFICFLVFPSVAMLLILAPMLVRIIPRYEKWEPALLPLMLISVNTVFATVTTQLTNLLNAVGKIKTTFKLMVMWTALTYVFVPLMAIKYGVNGAAFGYAIVGMSSIVAIYIAGKIVKFSLGATAGKPFLSSIILFILLSLLRSVLPLNMMSVGILIAASAVLYFGVSYFVVGSLVLDDVKKGFSTLFSKS